MSATFKNAKKLAQQEQLRKLMKEHKKVLKEPRKIESPLAKYNDLGQLTCILCKSVVRSEAVWPVHINAKQHKQNIELAKKLKEKTNNFTTPLKRPLTPPLPENPVKKIKGILKNAPPSKVKSVSSADSSLQSQDQAIASPSCSEATKNIPQGKTVDTVQNKEILEDPAGELPEGFFDDPILDAKARHLEYKDPLEVEWEKFMKEMKVVGDESEAIIAGDQDEATADRHIEEIDEQIVFLNKVLVLEKKKEVAVELLNKLKSEPRAEDEEVDEDIEEFLDWRQKKAF